MQYYQGWTKEKIKKMTPDEFVEFIGKLWSMIVWGNKKYIADKIIEINGFENIKDMIIDLLYGTDSIEKRWDRFYKAKTRLGPSSMSELLSYINPNEYKPNAKICGVLPIKGCGTTANLKGLELQFSNGRKLCIHSSDLVPGAMDSWIV